MTVAEVEQRILLSRPEAARMLRTEYMLQKLIDAGLLPVASVPGGREFFDRRDIENAVQVMKQGSSAVLASANTR